MKRFAAIAVLLLVTPDASATWIHHGYPEYFGETASPATLKWELATEAGERVLGLIQTGIPGISEYNDHVYGVFERQGGAAGIEWDAFEAAANNPAFTRSIITFGGIERERPAARDFAPGTFELYAILAAVEDYRYPATQDGITLLPVIHLYAVMLDVPEPGTWVLVAMALLLTRTLKRGR